MSHCWNHVGRMTVFATCCCVSAITTHAIAREDASLLMEQPAAAASEQPILAPPQNGSVVESIPAPRVAVAEVHLAPPIDYHASRSARRMYRCHEQVELVMITKNPADGCLYEIPLCMPACCVGEPTIAERRGLAGRGVVEYCWDCGFTATVKFRHRRGDVKVAYDG